MSDDFHDADDGMQNLLDMHPTEMHRDDGFWWKIEAWQVPVTKERPHGLRYNLTLHDEYNQRVFGMDNAHSVKPPKKMKFAGKLYAYDHVHRTAKDKGVPYQFDSCHQLLLDFFNGVDETIERIQQGK